MILESNRIRRDSSLTILILHEKMYACTLWRQRHEIDIEIDDEIA